MKYCWIAALLFLIALADGQTTAVIPSPENKSSAPANTTITAPAAHENTDNSPSPSSGNASDETQWTTSTSTPPTLSSAASNNSTTISTSTISPVTSDNSTTTGTINDSSTTTSFSSNSSSQTTNSNIENSSTTVSNTSVFVMNGSTAEVTSTPTTISSSSSAATTGGHLLPGVRISETNILLTDSDSDSYFVEMQIYKNVNISNVWLVILDANKTSNEEALLNNNCNITKNSYDIYTYEMNNETEFWNKSKNLHSVLIALYADENSAKKLSKDGLYDILMYSSNGSINSGLVEEFADQNLIIDHKKLNGLHAISLSRCSAEDEVANTAVVLTYKSPGGRNLCDLTVNKSLEMKLTRVDKDCSSDLIDNFNQTLAKNVITDVNLREHCGFAFYMFIDMKITKVCSSKINEEINVEFTVRSAFNDQLSLIISGYENFLTKPTLDVYDEIYNLNCYYNCFPKESPPTDSDDGKIQVTIAVVVSCITVFLLVVLFVFLYLRRKKKGILQFSMTRLDEDDDLIGDMDDFVGNQGPTFRSFK